MTFYRADLPGGVTAIFCGGRKPKLPAICLFCPRESVKLCDFPVRRHGRRATCDVPLCDVHATNFGNTDLCPSHATEWRAKFRPDFGKGDAA